MIQKITQFFMLHQKIVLRGFLLGYVSLLLICATAGYGILTDAWYSGLSMQVGSKFGTIAVGFFTLSILPGILGRFGIRHSLISLGFVYRQQTGIAMFVLAGAHALLVSTLPKVALGMLSTPPRLFEFFGILSMLLLFPLFLTSNVWSKKLLGRNWKRLHMLVYIICWTIVLHIFLRGELGSALLLGFVGIAEIFSLLYASYAHSSNKN